MKLWPALIDDLLKWRFGGMYGSLFAAVRANGRAPFYVACVEVFQRRSRALTVRLIREMSAFFNCEPSTIIHLAARDGIRLACGVGSRSGSPDPHPDVEREEDLAKALEWFTTHHPELRSTDAPAAKERATNRVSDECASDVEAAR